MSGPGRFPEAPAVLAALAPLVLKEHVLLGGLSAQQQAQIGAALAGIHPPNWVAGIRAAGVAQRAARRLAWEARQPRAHGSEQASLKKGPV